MASTPYHGSSTAVEVTLPKEREPKKADKLRGSAGMQSGMVYMTHDDPPLERQALLADLRRQH